MSFCTFFCLFTTNFSNYKYRGITHTKLHLHAKFQLWTLCSFCAKSHYHSPDHPHIQFTQFHQLMPRNNWWQYIFCLQLNQKALFFDTSDKCVSIVTLLWPFCSCDLDLDLMNLKHELHLNILMTYLHTKMRFPGQGFQNFEQKQNRPRIYIFCCSMLDASLANHITVKVVTVKGQ